MPKFFFLVGNIGAGKTEALKALRKKGYPCLSETKPSPVDLQSQSWKTRLETLIMEQSVVLQRFKKIDSVKPEENIVFVDRSPLDGFYIFQPDDLSPVGIFTMGYQNLLQIALRNMDCVFIHILSSPSTCHTRCETRPLEKNYTIHDFEIWDERIRRMLEVFKHFPQISIDNDTPEDVNRTGETLAEEIIQAISCLEKQTDLV